MKPRSAPISAEERERLSKGLSATIFANDEERKKKEKEAHDVQIAREAEERRAKETVLPPKPETAWQKEERELEAEGIAGLGRSAEEVAIGERRTDWKRLG